MKRKPNGDSSSHWLAAHNDVVSFKVGGREVLVYQNERGKLAVILADGRITVEPRAANSVVIKPLKF